MLKPGDVVVVDFPGVTGIKRRPAIVLSSDAYHSTRPDVILGLITSQFAGSVGPTDHALVDWAVAGLRLPSLFRSFLVTLPGTAVYQVAGHLSDPDWLAVRAKLGTAWRFEQSRKHHGNAVLRSAHASDNPASSDPPRATEGLGGPKADGVVHRVVAAPIGLLGAAAPWSSPTRFITDIQTEVRKWHVQILDQVDQ